MPRLERITPVGVPVHVIQRGNNRQVIFADSSDFKVFASWLKEYSKKFGVAVHAWCFMTNHVHLLCSCIKESDAISKMMQTLGRQYVRYFNKKYQRTGTLWEGRYRSCLVDQDAYLFELYRYIELNPVRAGMVDAPDQYAWSSYQVNALGRESDLCSPHPLYLALGDCVESRQLAYRGLFQELLKDPLVDEIRQMTNQGLAIGSERFKLEIEALTHRRVRPVPRGRRLGWRKGEN